MDVIGGGRFLMSEVTLYVAAVLVVINVHAGPFVGVFQVSLVIHVSLINDS